MKTVLIIVGVVLGAAGVFVISIFAVSEAGEEIVILRTFEADGSPVETRLWVVEDGGYAWLRAGVPSSGWMLRIDDNPNVVVTRHGRAVEYRAVPVREPAARDRVHALMREHYGLADRWISLIRDASLSVPVRLELRPPGG